VVTADVDEETYVYKYRVTMVSWSTSDEFVVTAVNDFSLKVWNSHSGQLLHMLQVCTPLYPPLGPVYESK